MSIRNWSTCSIAIVSVGAAALWGCGDSAQPAGAGTTGSGSSVGSGGTGNVGGGGSGGQATGSGGSGGNGGSYDPHSEIGFAVSVAGLLDGNSTGWEEARDVAFDAAGNIYVVGGTSAADFPTTAGAFDETYNTGGSGLGSQGNTDAFVTKLDPNGNIVWSTYLGGPNYDRAYAVEVDASGAVYVAGRAGDGFPTTPGAHQTSFAGDFTPQGAYGDQDGFVTKLAADGGSLVWSTYVGDTAGGFIRDIDIDAMGRVHIAATAIMGDMSAHVTSNAVQPTRNGDCDSFYARLSADGSTIEYGTYFGGMDSGGYYSGNPSVRALADGTAIIQAYDPGSGAPTTAAAYQPANAGGTDFLVARFLPNGVMDWCTYLGGSGSEGMDTHSLVLDDQGNPILAGGSTSSDYPTTDGSIYHGQRDFVISKLSADGTTLLASTIQGGTAGDTIEGIGIDGHGNIYFTGHTLSNDLPVTTMAFESSYPGERSGIFGVLSADFNVWRHLSYDGILGEYADRSMALGADGTWAIVGATWKMNPFPATSGQDGQIAGQYAAFFRLLQPLR